MPEPFDPYSEWLGIAPEEQPPDHYRLLGIAPFEPGEASPGSRHEPEEAPAASTPQPGDNALSFDKSMEGTSADESPPVGTPEPPTDEPTQRAAPLEPPLDWAGDWSGPIAGCTARIQQNPTSREYLNRGIYRVKNGEADGGIADFDQAIRLDPHSARAFFNRGVAWIRRGDPDKAIVDFDRALQLQPTYPLAREHRDLAWKMRKNGGMRQAPGGGNG